ncbi:flocculation protein FLO11 isoform X1 [Ananas comosus]|uniref:Flocculation protein FLO11 isoform X1 n=1 Tax=Ananas comosus TaxID=4615 RepID=A0A6P5FID1_ANACO|nr:flocculation protein FLO11 isoform X1 [Ananas comosus]
MKGRSQRPHPPPTAAAAAEPSDDWGDGSWTVDCSCGVTFDDGEEMVSCDECGVWVHTRCARFVRGDPSFACHNCKPTSPSATAAAAGAAAADGGGDDNEEETEVAQLLAELPTKTAFRRWGQVPREDRVHVQGPALAPAPAPAPAPALGGGGDHALFGRGLSSVFTANLWRCAGYVPKKFGFRYREFPCWDEESQEDGDRNASHSVADTLFSLSKDAAAPPSSASERNRLATNCGKKERSANKRKKESAAEEGKELLGRKKVRSNTDRASGDTNRRGEGSVPIIDMNKSDASEGRNLQVDNSVVTERKAEDKKGETDVKPRSPAQQEGTNVVVVVDMHGDSQTNTPSAEDMASLRVDQKVSAEVSLKVETVDVVESVKAEVSAAANVFRGEGQDAVMESIKVEPKTENPSEVNQTVDSCTINSESLKSVINSLRGSQDLPDVPLLPDSNGATSLNLKPDEVEADKKLDRSDNSVQHHQSSSGQLSENLQDHESAAFGLPSGKPKSQDSSRTAEQADNAPKQGVVDADGAHKIPIELRRHSSACLDEPVKTEALSITKASSASAVTISRSVSSISLPTAGKAAHSTKQQQEKPSVSAEESLQEHSRRPAKHPPKASQMSRAASSSATKSRLSDRTPGNEATSQQSHIKPTASSVSYKKNERVHQPYPQPSSLSDVINNSISPYPTASDSTTALSDEQLALLLHQQLNSSPRVPRVPRARQSVGGQFAPSTGASVFSKRSSQSGGRDHAPVFKKKSKEDGSRDSSRNSRESDDEIRKLGKESTFSTDGSVTSMQKSLLGTTVEGATNSSSLSPCLVAPTGLNVSSVSSSPRENIPIDYSSYNSRTLPGLIDEIMCKNRNITYEELCDAVQPHWNDLRKPNGDRYAYPSHLHAVHDCLRNRSEWAHLIDQAPKTNSGKKRREFRGKGTGDAEDKSGGESHREDFPKGKRKARKRRRLELKGRAVNIKDGIGSRKKRRIHGPGSASDNDNDILRPSAASLSRSSNEEGNEKNHSSDGESQETLEADTATSSSSSSESE